MSVQSESGRIDYVNSDHAPMNIKSQAQKKDESKNVDTQYGRVPTDKSWTQTRGRSGIDRESDSPTSWGTGSLY